MFLAFPAILPATVTLISSHEKRKKRACGLTGEERGKDAAALDAAGAAKASWGLLSFALICWSGFRFWPTGGVLLLATGLWFAIALLIWYASKHVKVTRL